jgi:hypothetical protein
MKGTYCHLINPTLSLLTWIILGSLHLLCQVVCDAHQSMTLTSISPLTYRPTALPSLSYTNRKVVTLISCRPSPSAPA